MFELVPAKAAVSNFNLFLTEQLKGRIQAQECSPTEQSEYLIWFQALKVPTNQQNGEADDSFILIRRRGEKKKHPCALQRESVSLKGKEMMRWK